MKAVMEDRQAAWSWSWSTGIGSGVATEDGRQLLDARRRSAAARCGGGQGSRGARVCEGERGGDRSQD